MEFFTFAALLALVAPLSWGQHCGLPKGQDVLDLKSFQTNGNPVSFTTGGNYISSATRHARLVGGEEVNDPTGGAACWQVYAIVARKSGSTVFMGGAILNKRTIAVVAQSFNIDTPGDELTSIRVWSGVTAVPPIFSAVNCEQGTCTPDPQLVPGCGKELRVKSHIVYPGFVQKSFLNDIALIILDENLDFTLSSVKPALQPFKFARLTVSPLCFNDTLPLPDDLYVCASNPTVAPCFGDGAALACWNQDAGRYYLAGVFSSFPLKPASTPGLKDQRCILGSLAACIRGNKFVDWYAANADGLVEII